MDNSTTSVSLSLGPMAINIYHWCLWLDLGLSLVLADSWLVCLPSWVGGLLSTSPELVEGTGSELQVRFLCAVFCDMMLGCEMWFVLHTNELWETSNAARNWRRQWTNSDLVQCHSPRPGSCQSWCVLTNDIAPGHQRDIDWLRERLFKAYN